MIITATQRQIPVTPRKMRMMAVAIKQMRPQEAIEQLGFLNNSAALPLQKVLKTATANAINNHKLNADNLTIKEIVVNQGWTLKRWQAGARGRGKPYTRRRAHVTVKLESKAPVIAQKTAQPKTTKTAAVTPKKEIKITKKIAKSKIIKNK